MLVEILLKHSGHFLKECNKVSIASTYCSALARMEQLLRTAIIKVGGSHTQSQQWKRKVLLLYRTFCRASSLTSSWVCHVPQKQNFTPFPLVAKWMLHFRRMCALWHCYTRLLS